MSQPVPAPGAYTDDDLEHGWDDPAEAEDDPILARRQRMRWVTGKTSLLFALLVGLVGFYVGVRVEKSSASTSSSSSLPSASSHSASRTGGFASFGSGGASRGTGGFPSGGFPGGGFGGGGTRGTVASVDGDTIYVKETSGNTVKVKLLSTTTLTKSETVGRNAIHPGDTVTIAGDSKAATITATSVTDSGDSSSGSSATSTGSSSSAG